MLPCCENTTSQQEAQTKELYGRYVLPRLSLVTSQLYFKKDGVSLRETRAEVARLKAKSSRYQGQD